jgi:hypothetical protein
MTITDSGQLVIAQTMHQIISLDLETGSIISNFGNPGNNESVARSPLDGSIWVTQFWGGVQRVGSIFSKPEPPTVNIPTRAGSGELTWTWSPNSTGGSPITSYSWSGACSGSGNVTTVTCSNLTGGTNYTLTVTATNAIGTSASSSKVGKAITVPSSFVATANSLNGALSVTWQEPASTGGAPIIGYRASATFNGKTYSCTTTTFSCTIPGLKNGTTYSVSVVATNAMGNSAPSTAVTVFPAPDIKFVAFAPITVAPVKTNVPVMVSGAKPNAMVSVVVAGSTKTCIANTQGQCSAQINSNKSGGWVLVASYRDGNKTVTTTSAYRLNLATVTVSSVQVKQGKNITVKLASGAPLTKFQVTTSDGKTYSVTLNSAGAGSVTVPTSVKGVLTLIITDNGTLLQTATVAVV